jgi:hypothetical protein
MVCIKISNKTPFWAGHFSDIAQRRVTATPPAGAYAVSTVHWLDAHTVTAIVQDEGMLRGSSPSQLRKSVIFGITLSSSG